MLEKIKNKEVKLLVASNSGVGAGISIAGGFTKSIATSGIVIISGILSDYDDEYIEISNSQILYMNVNGEQPMHEKHKSIYVNKRSVISISIDN